jgi:hypothetical protein
MQKLSRNVKAPRIFISAFCIFAVLLCGLVFLAFKQPFKTGEWIASKPGYHMASYGIPRSLLGVCDLQVRVQDPSGTEVARATIFRGIDTREECKTGDQAIKDIKTDDRLTRLEITVSSGSFSVPVEIGRFQNSDFFPK